MFNNIIYFIIVLLVFSLGKSDREQAGSLLYSISMIFLLWFILAVYCRAGFKRLARSYKNGTGSGYAAIYNRLVFRLSLISIFIFSLDVFSFDLKYCIEIIPVVGNIYIFQGVAAIFIFILYLSTIWYFAHPVSNIIFNTDIGKKAFILWNIRLNLPVVFPWLLLSIGFDFLSLSPWPVLNSFLEQPAGQILFFGIFLAIAVIFLPVLVQFFWGCRPIERSIKAESIRNFFKGMGFKYRALVDWPLLGGKMMTAGIMGIIPRFRYVMITESLMEILNPPELNAVMAHEVGHAKYYHQLLLSLLFLGFFVLLLGFSDPLLINAVWNSLVYMIPGDIKSGEFYAVILSVPMLLTLIIYFRFIMGFFMRHFERQADAYAALTVGDPSPIVNSLEKIAWFSGKTRDLPSWHHFSIKQRIDFLIKSHRNPELIKRHRHLVLSSCLIYLGVILSLAYILFLTPVKEHIAYGLINRVMTEEVEKKPNDVNLLMSLAMLYTEEGRPDKTVETYEKILTIDRKQPTALNNLAWLLLTTDDPDVKDIRRGLELAKAAVELKPLPEFLDTLAEAYWANGNNEMAVRIEKEAIMRDKTNNPLYRKQLEKFIKVKRLNI